MPQPLVWT